MVRILYTSGYEGRSIESFLSTLKKHHIACLLDVREIPLSRKKGFSKTALRNHLEENDIQYIHLRQLGSPSVVRKKLKDTKNYTGFFRSMEIHLQSEQDAIDSAYRHSVQKICCLLCFEKQAEYCHRSLVAQKIKERDGTGLKISNL